jgi:hypothetical protein
MARKRRKRKKSDLSKLQDKIWHLCKLITRKNYEHTCYTCGAKNLSGVNLHTGHLIPKKVCKPTMKYDLRILRPQCQKCNLRSEGMGAIFYRNMLRIEGQEYVDKIIEDYYAAKALKPKEIKEYYQELLERYEQINP